ncbi:Glucan endo-1,3-alpha-glucosidase agn1 [Paecilomyces lecythidis]|uniref:Glucan endo-1,3-alpha-glucosidase agn1 n=1 Tax=Paecilomyces lecythidis TaxID=3004212 RepID=A0ABR3WNV4_9EURO
MKVLTVLYILLFVARGAWAKAVFAHFMVTNTADYKEQDWKDTIVQAQGAKIDAFALNIAHGESMNAVSIEYAFAAAEASSFKLFFSFDYAGKGPWAKEDVIYYLSTYTSSSAYYKHNGKPLVSTFEGPENAADWVDIKNAVNCFFIPDWSSVGAKVALDKGNIDGTQVVDGLFNWGAWPEGANDMDTDIDASYQLFLDGKPYMMPVSPWFYTNLPGFSKNWLWRGDDLWYTRWQQVLFVQPEFVEIITWNDYGESHYIGDPPPYASGFNAFDVGDAPFNYAEFMPHGGWRHILPFLIDYYKNGNASFSSEVLSTWYRLNPVGSCLPAGTTANNVDQLQMEMDPASVLEDKVFYSGLLASSCDVTVEIGGTAIKGTWSNVPAGGIGVYHGSVSTNGLTGDVVVTLSSGGTQIAQVNGEAITRDCSENENYENFNAWTGSATSSRIVSATTPLNLDELACTKGTGKGDMQELCEFTCKYGYCPVGACTCLALGTAQSPPDIVDIQGYPGPGKDCNYIGLCSYACNHGFCPDNACSTDPAQDGACDSVIDPHAGLVCNSGSGTGYMTGLCSWTCNYGFCPDPCTCDGWGTQNTPPSGDYQEGYAVPSADVYDSLRSMCDYACRHGYCPDGVCTYIPTGGQYVKKEVVDCKADADNWNCVTCGDNTGCVEADMSGPKEWACSNAQDLLDYFIANYNGTDHQDGRGPWLQHLAETCGFYTSAVFDCTVATASDGCVATRECSKDDNLAGNVVLNSVIGMRNWYTDWYQAMGSASNAMEAFSEDFNDAFNPSEDDIFVELTSSILGAAIDAASVGVFKLSSRIASAIGGSINKGVWDKIYGLTADPLKSAVQDQWDDADSKGELTYSDLKELIYNITSSYQRGITNYFDVLTNGEPDNKKVFAELLSTGVWLRNITQDDPNFSTDSQYELAQSMATIILSTLLPTVWRSHKNYVPALIMSDTADDTSNPFAKCKTGLAGPEPCLSDEEAAAARYSTGGKTFWLVASQKGCQAWSDYGGSHQCITSRFFSLPGTDQLTGNIEKWGNLSVADIVISDYAGYQLNGNANGYNISAVNGGANIIDSTGQASLYKYDSGAQTPGLWDFPICDYDTAEMNWAGSVNGIPGTCTDFPCCTCDQIGVSCDE